MVVYFDAMNILVSYVSQPKFDHNISIKILVAPPVDDALLLWKNLFNDPKLFPTIDQPLLKTDNEILFCLERATSSNPKHSLEFANAALASWGKQDVPNTVKNIKELQDSTLPGWHHSVATLFTILDASPYLTSSDDCTISNKIQLLCDGARSFLNLNGLYFLGMLHSEACLVSLLVKDITTAGEYYGILEQLKVGYVCVFFLSSDSHFL